ncbi:hypothetical protein HPB50_001558 [Hyalomma asiaticum]|uniref:Uncharacterized protein n=1 Tax=Hyalomma asiaticum TaxID=266040 RepID=A0ACB7SM58_HYAAI|nr:hypothetical protein HPB50_001558 [Hyalomma asiaticum]
MRRSVRPRHRSTSKGSRVRLPVDIVQCRYHFPHAARFADCPGRIDSACYPNSSGSRLVLPSLGFDEEPPERYHFLNTLGGSLRCRGHGSPSPSLWWIHADDLNGSSSSASWAGSVGVMMSTPAALSEVPGLRHTSADGSTLLFPAFGASEFRAHVHSTAYRCVLSNALGKMASRAVRVRAGHVRKRFPNTPGALSLRHVERESLPGVAGLE